MFSRRLKFLSPSFWCTFCECLLFFTCCCFRGVEQLSYLQDEQIPWLPSPTLKHLDPTLLEGRRLLCCCVQLCLLPPNVLFYSCFLLCCSVPQSRPTLCNFMGCRRPGFSVHHQLQSLLKLMSIESVMSSNHLILCCPLLLPPSIYPRFRVF